MGIGISFLGTGNYQTVVYQYENFSIETKYFPFAFCNFFNLDELFVVVTEESRQKHLDALIDLFKNCENTCSIKEVLIPLGRNENELWDIFDTLANALPANSSIYFDITHTFRSIPLMIFAICNYLTALKNIKIERIIYGAFEARENNIAPVFDLTPFLDLIRFSYAIDHFIRFGNAELLKESLRSIQSNAFKMNLSEKPKEFTSFADTLANLTNALAINRIEEAILYSAKLSQKLEPFANELLRFKKAKPFGFLIEKIRSRFSNISLAGKSLFSKIGFQSQLLLLDFFVETNQFVQAITLSREIIVSFLVVKRNFDPRKRIDRETVEKELGKLAKDFENNVNLPKFENNIAQLWSLLSTTRNDINHAGMNEHPMKTITAIQNIKNICQQVKNLITTYSDDI